jgi:hypothetical protein
LGDRDHDNNNICGHNYWIYGLGDWRGAWYGSRARRKTPWSPWMKLGHEHMHRWRPEESGDGGVWLADGLELDHKCTPNLGIIFYKKNMSTRDGSFVVHCWASLLAGTDTNEHNMSIDSLEISLAPPAGSMVLRVALLPDRHFFV